MKNNKSSSGAKIDKLEKKIIMLEEKLVRINSAFLNLIGKSLDAIVIVDHSKMVVYVNYAAIQLFQSSITNLLGEPLDISFDPKIIANDKKNKLEYIITQDDESEIITQVIAIPIEWNQEPAFAVTFRDITEQKKYETQLDYRSNHDALTHLANRSYFEKKIEMAIKQTKKSGDYIALLFIDLDNFKEINDQYGHDAGDSLLKSFSEILLSCSRTIDTVARLGGDEFVILVTKLKKLDHAEKTAERILAKLETPISVLNNKLVISTSIGISFFDPSFEISAEEFIKNADQAMYSAKKSGKRSYQIYSSQ